MPDIPISAALFYDGLADIRARNLRTSRRLWLQMSPQFISQSWARLRGPLLASLAASQVEAATLGATYGAFALAEQGAWVAPEAFVNPRSFAGWTSSGADLRGTLEFALTDTLTARKDGATRHQALAQGWQTLSGIVNLQVNDAGRLAASIDVASRKGVGYVRMLNPPSCERCIILAGRFYRWNAGFRRHPGCDCVHVTSSAGSTQAARDEGLIDDPYAYFNSLDEKGQDRVFGPGNAQAIRDGGDIYQVVNSKRGRVGAFTTEGTSRRGYAAGTLRPGQRRMTPDTIYRTARTREEAIDALRQQGYILPGGQVAGGSIRGARYEGFGQMGRGGTRKAASQAVLEARRTGVRDPNNRYTMTAAERMDYDIEQRWRSVLEGRSPFVNPGFGNRPDPTGLLAGYGRSSASGSTRVPTPLEAALVEAEYRALLIRRAH